MAARLGFLSRPAISGVLLSLGAHLEMACEDAAVVNEPSQGRLLRRYPQFTLLWAARSISNIGDGAALLALILYVKATQESGARVGLLLLAQAAPRFLGPVAGAIVDRTDQRRTMIICDLGQAGTFALIALLTPSFVVLLLLVLVASWLATVFAPASRTSVVGLVADPDLMRANAWLGTALNLQVAIGPLLGGVLIAAFDFEGALLANALTFVLSAALLWRLPPLPARPRTAAHRFFGEVKEGLSVAWGNKTARLVVITLFLGVLFGAVDNLALVFLARDVFGTGPLGFAVLSAAYGIGMFAGSIALIRGWIHTPPLAIYLIGWFLSGFGMIVAGLAPVLALAVAMQLVCGFGNAVDVIASDTLIQRAIPPAMLGRVFGLISTAAYGASSIGYVLGGPLLDLTSARTVFVVGGAGILVVLLFGLALARDLERETPQE